MKRNDQPTQQPTPVHTRTATEWDNLRAELGYRPADEVAAELETRKAAWSQQRKAYEATLDQAHAEAQKQQARHDHAAHTHHTRHATRVARVRRLITDATRSLITPATLITNKATKQPTPSTDPWPTAPLPPAARQALARLQRALHPAVTK